MTEQEKQKLKDILIEHKNIASSEYDDEDAFVGIYFCDLVDIIDGIIHNICWHPASELPPVDRNGNSKLMVVIDDNGLPNYAYFHSDNLAKFWVKAGDWNMQQPILSVKWWCYPPKEE